MVKPIEAAGIRQRQIELMARSKVGQEVTLLLDGKPFTFRRCEFADSKVLITFKDHGGSLTQAQHNYNMKLEEPIKEAAIFHAVHNTERCTECRPCVILSKHIFDDVDYLVGIINRESLHHALQWLLGYNQSCDRGLDEMVKDYAWFP